MSSRAKFGFILEYVTDVEAAKHFYEDVLGLETRRYHPTFVQFDDFAIASDESLSGTREPEVYWIVDDANQALADLSGKAEIVFPLKQMPFGKVFGIKDPAGQPLYLLEFSRDRPSRPVT